MEMETQLLKLHAAVFFLVGIKLVVEKLLQNSRNHFHCFRKGLENLCTCHSYLRSLCCLASALFILVKPVEVYVNSLMATYSRSYLNQVWRKSFFYWVLNSHLVCCSPLGWGMYGLNHPAAYFRTPAMNSFLQSAPFYKYF